MLSEQVHKEIRKILNEMDEIRKQENRSYKIIINGIEKTINNVTKISIDADWIEFTTRDKTVVIKTSAISYIDVIKNEKEDED